MKKTDSQVPVRIDGDLTALLQVEAERSGITLTAHLNAVLRRAVAETTQVRPQYVPPGRTPEAYMLFKREIDSALSRLWVFTDIVQPVAWMLPGRLVGANSLSVTVDPMEGRPVTISVDRLLAWTEYKNDLERATLEVGWVRGGAIPHPAAKRLR